MKPYELFFQPGDTRYSMQSNDGDYYKQKGIVDDNRFNQHLQGTITLGAFTTYQNTCPFGVWDIDINKSTYSHYEDTSKAFDDFKDEIVDILKQFHILLQDYPHYMEFSGRKGAHVWIFFEEPMPSESVFNFLQKMERKIKFRHEVFHIETFPKQGQTNGDGNLIKVPLATHRVTGKKAYWCDPFLNEIDLKWEDIKRIQKDDFTIVNIPNKKKTFATTQSSKTSAPDFVDYTQEGLQRLENRCVALQNAQTEGTSQSNNWHIFVGAVYGRLNLGNKVHETLNRYAFDYDPQTTDYHLSKLMDNMASHPRVGCKFAVANGLCNHPCHTVTPFDHLVDNYPMFIDEVQNSNANFVTTSSNHPLFSLSTASVNLNMQMATIFSTEVIPQASKAIEAYLDIFAMNNQNTAGKAIVLNTIPGGFKTTATIEMVADALKEDKDFGAVIAVERNVDVKRIANEINSAYGILFQPAYAFYGYDQANPQECVLGHKTYKAGMCDKKNCGIPLNKCRVKMNHLVQHNYRVIVMSHQRLKMYSQAGEMKRFQNWQNSISMKFRRSHLIIDEQPPLLEIMRFDSDTLNNFLTILPKLENGIQFIQPVIELQKTINNRVTARELIQPKEVPEFRFDARFENSWKDFTLQMPSIYNLPVALESVYNYGGIYINKNLSGLPEISTGYYLNNTWDFDRTIILDGTADISQRYKPQVFDKVYVPQLHTYEHLTFYYYNKFNLSRSTYENKPNLIQSLNEDIKEIVKKRTKVYVVVYKENEESYKKELDAEIKSGKVILRTFGSTRGDNSMRDCDTIIFTGLIHKGELNYLSESLVLNQDYKMNLNAQKYRKSRKFKDRNTEIIKMSSWLEDFVQEVYRTRLRSHNLSQDVQAYLIVSDPDFLNLIEGYFEGCKMEEWQPLETSESVLNSTAQNIVDKVLKRIEAGETLIPKSSLGINSSTLRTELNRHPEIRKILKTKGVEISTRAFIKT